MLGNNGIEICMIDLVKISKEIKLHVILKYVNYDVIDLMTSQIFLKFHQNAKPFTSIERSNQAEFSYVI